MGRRTMTDTAPYEWPEPTVGERIEALERQGVTITVQKSGAVIKYRAAYMAEGKTVDVGPVLVGELLAALEPRFAA
jgi:hypothetical protein